MLAVGPLGPQYSLLFAWNELGKHAHLGIDTLPTQRVPQKILKKSISLYYTEAKGLLWSQGGGRGFVFSGAVPTHSLLKLHWLGTIVKWKTEPGLVEGIYNKMEEKGTTIWYKLFYKPIM